MQVKAFFLYTEITSGKIFLLYFMFVLRVSMAFNPLCLKQSQSDMQFNNLISPESHLTQNTASEP